MKITVRLNELSFPFSTGAAALGLVLEFSKIKGITHEITSKTFSISWDCSDEEAVSKIQKAAYKIENGNLVIPALGLAMLEPLLSDCIVRSFLQHPSQRKLGAERELVTEIDDVPIKYKSKEMLDCYYVQSLKECFDRKGSFKELIQIKSNHLPGAIECYSSGFVEVSPFEFLSIFMLPIACGYYKLPNFRMALVIPRIDDIKQWIGMKLNQSQLDYYDFKCSSAGEAGLLLLLKERAGFKHEKNCEVYQLGSQVWDANQKYLKQKVYRISPTDSELETFDAAYSYFPLREVVSKNGEYFIAESVVFPWICDNIVVKKPWYLGFKNFTVKNEKYVYESEGLKKMVKYEQLKDENLNVFINIVQEAFKRYLQEEGEASSEQGRKFDYHGVFTKKWNLLKNRNSLTTFRRAITGFLKFQTKSIQSHGFLVYDMVDQDWRKAQDLALLALSSYPYKQKENDNNE